MTAAADSAQQPWIVIPARGGSVGVPRKNVRMLAGKPLIAHSILTALQVSGSERVVVITDDDEIDEISRFYGATVVREKELASGKSTLDQLMLRHLPDLEAMGASDSDLLLTLQPTCPLLSSARFQEALSRFADGAASVITVKDDRHLSWTLDAAGNPQPLYVARVNRQQLPANYRESGSIIGCRIGDLKTHKTRIVQPIALVELPEQEALDIDTFADLVVAEHWKSRLSIVIRADAAPELGMGHVYRALALAQSLARHRILLVTSADKPLGAEFFSQYPFAHTSVSGEAEFEALLIEHSPDLLVLDLLDTEAEFVAKLRAVLRFDSKVVSFEDLGSGAEAVDLLVSDLYENPNVPAERQLGAVTNAILAPSFETLPRRAPLRTPVETVLVLFGGTDPSGLAFRALDALQAVDFTGQVTVVRGLGASPLEPDRWRLNLQLRHDVKNIAELMAQADIALSSAGRTLTELASIGVPTLCLAQNKKELGHSHSTEANGVIMLGLGDEVSDQQLQLAIQSLLGDLGQRTKLQLQAVNSLAERSNDAVIARILGKLGLKP